MIELVNVSKYYTSNGVTNKGLININLKLKKGEIVAITGESGSGKSTLLNVITKVDSFDEGEIYYKGNETSYFSIDDMDQFRKDKIGFIFQNYNIIDSYTVLDNVMLPLIIGGYSNKEAKEEALKIIEKVGLKDRVKNRGTQLSGGEKQRCVIARALASKSEILACDEPTGNLDSATSVEIINLIKEVADDKLVLIVTHNFDQVKDIATRKIKVEDGQIVEDLYVDKATKELDDINEDLDLDYKPIERKTLGRISLNNLISTPRKTFLIALVLFFTCVIALIMYQFIFKSVTEKDASAYFTYGGSNKIVVSDIEHNALDKNNISKISSKCYYNEFYYLGDGDIGLHVLDSEFDSDYEVNYEPNPKDYTIKYGTAPREDIDVTLLFNSSYWSKKEIKSFAGKRFKLTTYSSGVNNLSSLAFVIKNVGYCDSISSSSPVICNNEKVHTIFKTLYMKSFSNSDYILMFDFSNPTKAVVPTGAEAPKFTYFSNTIVDFLEVTTTSSDTNYSTIYVGNDIFENEIAYEATCYGNKKKMKKAAKKQSLYTIDTRTFTTMSKAMVILIHLESYLAMIGGTVVIIIIYFIAYAILAVIFRSKAESYNIFRTLGVTKYDMKKIVRNETLISVIFMTTLVYILSIIVGNICQGVPFVSAFKEITFSVTVFYFLVMILMGLLIARRFNRRLFNFTVREGLKQVK